MAQISFSADEQDSLFSFLILKENVPFQLEALQCFYELCSLNINDICSVFQRKRRFSPFLQLLGTEQEKVRLIHGMNGPAGLDHGVVQERFLGFILFKRKFTKGN